MKIMQGDSYPIPVDIMQDGVVVTPEMVEDVEITDQLRDKALSIAKELCCQDGTLEDAVNTTVAWIWWETKGA